MKNSAFLPITLLMLAPASLIATPQASYVQHGIVYHENGRFGGWPANNGIWSWGDEIAVGFTRGWYKDLGDDHSRDPDKPAGPHIARSLDGGVTWKIEPFALPEGEGGPVVEPVNFAHPDFAMRVRDGVFFVSYDRARTWKGPYSFPDFKLGNRLTSRTDYLVNSAHDCTVFLSVRDERVKSGIPDRAFAVRTRDGGRSFKLLGWMDPDDPPVIRAVMPSTVRASDGTLVSLLRRRYDLESTFRNDINWIDAFTSRDAGETWKHAARIAHTDHTGRNGNPPSLVKLPDGRLAAAYGVRSNPMGIRARVSSDNGLSWGPEMVLRDDGRTWDLGYCRSVVRRDGKIVTVYYYTTEQHVENHIAATIWSP